MKLSDIVRLAHAGPQPGGLPVGISLTNPQPKVNEPPAPEMGVKIKRKSKNTKVKDHGELDPAERALGLEVELATLRGTDLDQAEAQLMAQQIVDRNLAANPTIYVRTEKQLYAFSEGN